MPITKERLEEIKAFKNTDFSDCPELTDEQLSQLKPSHYRKTANKKNVNVSLDIDIIEWLQSTGMSFQTRMNSILREAMLVSST